MDINDLYFCYSKRVSDFLSFKQVKYLTKAINPINNKLYSLYYKTPKLQAALDEYRKYHSQKE
ncbi:hypothetical protein AB0Y20_01325 [Heyndrickxia oleronia]|uniref:hypothetical protein n=1 Tax=Heyndrickxia oleronia TaxID=38875 RepID=UPI003F216760